jgi:hypothetical protein
MLEHLAPVVEAVLELVGKDLHGQVTYQLGDREWTQVFRARLLDDADLDEELARGRGCDASAGCRRSGWSPCPWRFAASWRQIGSLSFTCSGL